MREKTYTISIPEGDIVLSTGKLAKLAGGSVLLTMGGTTILATADINTSRETKQDFFPLSVEYIEKLYAGGTISGSRFLKREGFPSENAIIAARQVDHTIRQLFPKGFRNEVSVVITVLAYDGKHSPESLSVIGSSIALLLSPAPFNGPASSFLIGVDNEGKLIVNPDSDSVENLTGEFAVSVSRDGKILNMEGWGVELPEEVMNEIMDLAVTRGMAINKKQEEFVSDIAKKKMEYTDLPFDNDLLARVKEMSYDKLYNALYLDKETRDAEISEIRKSVVNELVVDGSGIEEIDVFNAIEYICRKITREGVLKSEKRLTERGLEEIRPLSAEADILPTVHGSALFSRGLTQSLSIVTLGSNRLGQYTDDMEGESVKYFMHHYNMPGYTTGETGRFKYKPGRREIGHGSIGENALMRMIPSQEEFPYTIRVVSEIMTSNGSTSMAATCASSMALMAAGVPMKAAVAGIGVGLMTADGNTDDYKLLLDIEGAEDFYGDMDFKVCGTTNGITAMQLETKLPGVDVKVLREAFALAKKGRNQVLEVMNSAISSPRPEVSPTAPRVQTLQIPVDKIGELIGPGGKNIRGLIEAAAQLDKGMPDVNIEDDGRVTVTAVSKKQIEFLVGNINFTTEGPKIGEVYEAKVDKVMPYGAFVDIMPGGNISGLVHISEMTDTRGANPADFVKEGQMVKVKMIKEERGKYSFSMKGVN